VALNANSALVFASAAGSASGGSSASARAVVRFTGTGSVLVAKGAANSDIAEAANTAANVISGAITGLWWSAAAGTITVARGANTIAVLSGSDHWNRDSLWVRDAQDATANLAVTFSTSAASNGVIYVEMSKQYGNT
jgi:hypothetical protein